MTLVTIPSIRERLNYNFVSLFKVSSKTDLVNSPRKLNSAIGRLVTHDLLSIKSLSVAKADGIFPVDRYNITFALSNKFADHFVLLRGLLEFGRPRTIKIIPSARDRNFYVEFSGNDAGHFVTHLEAILNSLVKEIKFKESLRALITFEEKVKREQAVLYANLKLSA